MPSLSGDYRDRHQSGDRVAPSRATYNRKRVEIMDLKLEIVIVPVTDVDRAKQFYGAGMGCREDADISGGGGYRVVQMTPPGSPCSIIFGAGVTSATPG